MAKPERHVAADKSVTWKVRFRGPTKKGTIGQTSETFRTKREADAFALWLRALGPQGALDRVYETEQQALVPTMTALALEDIKLRSDTTPGTRLNYERLWARTWGPIIGHIPANRLTEDDLRRGVMQLGERYSRKSLENQHGLLSGVVARAAKKGYLEENIARGLKLPAGKFTEASEMRILSTEEFEDLLARIPVHYQPFVDFLAGTGCRWGEAVALQVGDVRLPNVLIQRALKWSPDNNRVMGTTKTEQRRPVALPPELIAPMRAACEGKKKSDLVFTAPRGGPILHRTFWSRVWLPAVEGIEPRPRIHDLRHFHASVLLGQNVPIHYVQARLGHKKITTTVDTYGHLLPDAQTAIAQAASAVFSHRAQIEA